jgi:hypothetical protein
MASQSAQDVDCPRHIVGRIEAHEGDELAADHRGRYAAQIDTAFGERMCQVSNNSRAILPP